jgi:hypothetical protein
MWNLLHCKFFLTFLLIFKNLVDSDKQIVRIGGIFPITDSDTAKIDERGGQWLAGSLMGLNDLNEEYKSRNIEFKLAVRDSKKTFSNTVVACLELAQDVYDGNGSHVIVGSGFNPVTEAMAYVFSDPQNNLAQVAFASNESALGYVKDTVLCI